MNNPCPIKIDCPGTDFPVTNYSSESGEPSLPYIGVIWPPPVEPPAGSGFWATGCIGTCLSYVSQQEADECAQLQASLCDLGPNDGGGGGTGGGGSPQYSSEATCTVQCSNGTSFTYVANAGLFVAWTQAQAQAIANAYACEKAEELKVCLGDLQRCWCLDDARTSAIVATGGTIVSWITSGSLPTGLSFSNGVVSGTPTVAGTYSFTVRGYLANGSYAQRTYVLIALNITQTTLPNAAEGDNYDYQLTVSGGTAPYVFALTGGGFPLGVDITSAGLITGVAGEVGVFNPVIQITDASGCICSRIFSLTITGVAVSPCAYWTCDEVSGNRLDSVAGLEWTNSEAPGTGVAWIGSTPGMYSNAVRCYQGAAGSAVASLVTAYVSQIATSGNGFSMAGWFKIISSPGSTEITLTWTVDNGVDDWKLQVRLGSNPVAKIYDEFSADQNIFFTPTVGDWHFFHIWHEPTDQYMYFQLDNGAASNTPLPVTIPATTTGKLELFASSSLGNAAEVLIDELALKCSAPLTTEEATYLYNSGLGRTWPLT